MSREGSNFWYLKWVSIGFPSLWPLPIFHLKFWAAAVQFSAEIRALPGVWVQVRSPYNTQALRRSNYQGLEPAQCYPKCWLQTVDSPKTSPLDIISAWAAMDRVPWTGCLKHINLFLMVLEDRKYKIQVPTYLVSGETLPGLLTFPLFPQTTGRKQTLWNRPRIS